AVDRESCRPPLCHRAVDAVGTVEERNAATAKDKPGSERRIWELRAVLRLEDIECREARSTHVVVAHAPILRRRCGGPSVVDGPPRAAWPPASCSRCSCRSRGTCSTSPCAPFGRRTSRTRLRPPTS